MKLSIYADGSSDGKAGNKGGWGSVLVLDGKEIVRLSGSSDSATNNSMEISGAIAGLEWYSVNKTTHPDLGGVLQVELVSDSQLVLNYANGGYKCRKVHLIPLYIKLRKLYQDLGATTRWVRGHSGDYYNEICDDLAKAARTAEEN